MFAGGQSTRNKKKRGLRYVKNGAMSRLMAMFAISSQFSLFAYRNGRSDSDEFSRGPSIEISRNCFGHGKLNAKLVCTV